MNTDNSNKQAIRKLLDAGIRDVVFSSGDYIRRIALSPFLEKDLTDDRGLRYVLAALAGTFDAAFVLCGSGKWADRHTSTLEQLAEEKARIREGHRMRHWEKLERFPAACVELLALGQLGEATLGKLADHLPVDGRYPSSDLGPWLNDDGTEAACPMSGAWAKLNSDGTVDGETCSGYRYRITKTAVVLFASERAEPAQSTCFVPGVCRWARLNGFEFPEDLRAKLIQFARSDAFLSERIFRDDIDEIRSAVLSDLKSGLR